MASEIKITISKGGKTVINDKDVSGNSANFTKNLADDLGEIKERHADMGYGYTDETNDQTEKQY